jgi:hypothetical protein
MENLDHFGLRKFPRFFLRNVHTIEVCKTSGVKFQVILENFHSMDVFQTFSEVRAQVRTVGAISSLNSLVTFCKVCMYYCGKVFYSA